MGQDIETFTATGVPNTAAPALGNLTLKSLEESNTVTPYIVDTYGSGLPELTNLEPIEEVVYIEPVVVPSSISMEAVTPRFVTFEGEQAFEDLYRRFEAPLYSCLLSMLRDRDKAWDTLQNTFVKVYKALALESTRVEERAFTTWIYRIATNSARDVLRRDRLIGWSYLSQHVQDDQGSNTWADIIVDPEAEVYQQQIEDREMLEYIRDNMPPKYWSCLYLNEYESRSCREIAEALDISESAVKMRLMRARDKALELRLAFERRDAA